MAVIRAGESATEGVPKQQGRERTGKKPEVHQPQDPDISYMFREAKLHVEEVHFFNQTARLRDLLTKEKRGLNDRDVQEILNKKFSARLNALAAVAERLAQEDSKGNNQDLIYTGHVAKAIEAMRNAQTAKDLIAASEKTLNDLWLNEPKASNRWEGGKSESAKAAPKPDAQPQTDKAAVSQETQLDRKEKPDVTESQRPKKKERSEKLSAERKAKIIAEAAKEQKTIQDRYIRDLTELGNFDFSGEITPELNARIDQALEDVRLELQNLRSLSQEVRALGLDKEAGNIAAAASQQEKLLEGAIVRREKGLPSREIQGQRFRQDLALGRLETAIANLEIMKQQPDFAESKDIVQFVTDLERILDLLDKGMHTTFDALLEEIRRLGAEQDVLAFGIKTAHLWDNWKQLNQLSFLSAEGKAKKWKAKAWKARDESGRALTDGTSAYLLERTGNTKKIEALFQFIQFLPDDISEKFGTIIQNGMQELTNGWILVSEADRKAIAKLMDEAIEATTARMVVEDEEEDPAAATPAARLNFFDIFAKAGAILHLPSAPKPVSEVIVRKEKPEPQPDPELVAARDELNAALELTASPYEFTALLRLIEVSNLPGPLSAQVLYAEEPATQEATV